jgi:sarcosine oxidase
MDADVVIVGAGVMGCAAARSLARGGRSIVLLERFRIGHDRGSSHGSSRIFRYSYHDPERVRLAMASEPLWRELEDESGDELLAQIGGFDIGARMEEHAAALEAAGAGFEWLDASEVAERFPALSLAAGERALFQPDAGICHADRAWHAFARSARSAGADMREETTVLEVRTEGDGALAVTADGTFRAPIVVVTAGSWAAGLLRPLGIDLPVRVTRETVAYCRTPEETVLPSVVDWRGPPYFFSLEGPGDGLKIGRHMGGVETDPDEKGTASAESVDRIGEWVAERFPSAETPPFRAETCLYTTTPDEGFVLERHGPIVVGSPCSGHGFKFAPLIGERLAGLAGS